MSKIPPYDLDVDPLEALNRIEAWLAKHRETLEGPGDADAFREWMNAGQKGERPGMESREKFHALQAVQQIGEYVTGVRKPYRWESDEARAKVLIRTRGAAASWSMIASCADDADRHAEARAAVRVLDAMCNAIEHKHSKVLQGLDRAACSLTGRKRRTHEQPADLLADLTRTLIQSRPFDDGDARRIASIMVHELTGSGDIAARIRSARGELDYAAEEAWEDAVTDEIAASFRRFIDADIIDPEKWLRALLRGVGFSKSQVDKFAEAAARGADPS